MSAIVEGRNAKGKIRPRDNSNIRYLESIDPRIPKKSKKPKYDFSKIISPVAEKDLPWSF